VNVDRSVIDALEMDGEFTEAGYWEGTYRDLVVACAPGQHDLDLLPGLARHDQESSVFAALAMSTVDVYADASSATPDVDDLLAHAASEYAIRRRSRATLDLAPAFVTFIEAIPPEFSERLLGPRFLSPTRFEEMAPVAVLVDTDLGVALDPDGWLLAELP